MGQLLVGLVDFPEGCGISARIGVVELHLLAVGVLEDPLQVRRDEIGLVYLEVDQGGVERVK